MASKALDLFFRDTFGRTVDLVCAAVTKFAPPKIDKILFHSFPDFDDNARALFDHMASKPEFSNYEFIWLVNNASSCDGVSASAVRRAHSNVKIVYKRDLRAIFHFLTSAVSFTTHGTFNFIRTAHGRSVVNLWHGMPLKRIGLMDGKSPAEVQFCTHAIASSEFFLPIMAESFGLDLSKVLVTGLPRNDWLKTPQQWRHLFPALEKVELVVWMPTYRQSAIGEIRSDSSATSAVSDEFLQQLDSALEDSDVGVILKLHPMDTLNARVWKDYRSIRIFNNIEWSRSGLVTYRILGSADRLVTDFSSVAVDYAVTRRPIGLYAPDRDSYSRGFVPGVQAAFGEVMTELQNEDALIHFIVNGESASPNQAALDLLNAPSDEKASERTLKLLNIV